jgi:hypothetical protein
MVEAQCEQPQQQQHQQAATQGSRAQPAVPPAVVDAAGMYRLRNAGTHGGGGGRARLHCGSQLWIAAQHNSYAAHNARWAAAQAHAAQHNSNTLSAQHTLGKSPDRHSLLHGSDGAQ